jgi:PKD repeat protein
MRLLLSISVLFFFSYQANSQNCLSLFSYGANFETVSFFNQSQISNAHYWWNFGDGSGSYEYEPIHEYPDNGRYFVTLYAQDTVSNCTDYYELWINITKYSPDPCIHDMHDSIFVFNNEDHFTLIDDSYDCGNYSLYAHYGGGVYLPYGTWHPMGTVASRYLGRLEFINSDTQYEQVRTNYISVPHEFTSVKNYNSCSANFEFTTQSTDSTGKRIFFSAMNKNAISYHWYIQTMQGNPIQSYSDTISRVYTYSPTLPWTIYLITEDSNGCKDSLFQQILVRQGTETTVGIDDLTLTKKVKELIKITDLMGRETEDVPNTPLIYIYSDGTTEKIFRME